MGSEMPKVAFTLPTARAVGKYISSPKFKVNIIIITSYGMPAFCKLFLFFPSNFPNSHRVQLILSTHIIIVYLPRGLSGKESACNAGDKSSIPDPGTSRRPRGATKPMRRNY